MYLQHPEYLIGGLPFAVIGLHVFVFNRRKTVRVLVFTTIIAGIAVYLFTRAL